MTRTLIEALHIVAGLVGTALIASLAAWAVPNAADTIWQVAVVAMAIVALMGVQPLREAWRADHARDG